MMRFLSISFLCVCAILPIYQNYYSEDIVVNKLAEQHKQRYEQEEHERKITQEQQRANWDKADYNKLIKESWFLSRNIFIHRIVADVSKRTGKSHLDILQFINGLIYNEGKFKRLLFYTIEVGEGSRTLIEAKIEAGKEPRFGWWRSSEDKKEVMELMARTLYDRLRMPKPYERFISYCVRESGDTY